MKETQYRSLAAAIQRAKGEAENYDIRMSFSDEAPVLTYLWEVGEWAYEVLDHGPGSAQLERINANGMFVFCHDRTKPLGRVVQAEIAGDRKGYSAIRFLKNSLATDHRADIESGDFSGVSFGYYAWDYILEAAPADGGYKTYRARKWEVIEISAETTPASVGVGGERSLSTRTTFPAGSDLPGKSPQTHQAARSAATVGGHMPEATPADNSADMKALNEKINALERQILAGNTAQEDHARFLKFVGIANAQGHAEIGYKAAQEKWTDEKFGAEIAKVVGIKSAQIENDLDLSDGDKKRFSIIKLIRSLKEGNRELAGLEWECSDQIGKKWNKEPDQVKVTRAAFLPYDIQTRMLPAGAQKRDLNAGSQTAGGFTIQNQYGSLIELLRNNSSILPHVTMLNGLVGDLKIARQTGAGTAYWLGESGDPTESAQAFGLITMTRKKLGAMTDITEELLTQSSIDVEQFVINDLAKVIALAMDLACISGTGANGQPLGILNTSGIGSVTTSGGLTHAESVEFLTDIINSNYPANGVRYFTNGTIMGTCMTTLKDSAAGAGYIWEGGISNGRINGLPAQYSTNIPASTMIAVDPAAIMCGRWGDLQIGVDLAANFPSGGVRVRLLDGMDCALRHVGAVSVATDI